ncbi:MAG: hypothetical protein KF724_13415 [Phycisphaeraceae bacterium]|nr:hypothetical protein [Phycisphaeraceae bacterium]
MGQPDPTEDNDGPPPSPADFEVADIVMAKRFASFAEGTPEYSAQRTALARLRAWAGGDRFAFIYGLREPRNAVERIQRAVEQEGGGSDEFGRRLEAYAKRPIDVEMLEAFCRESSRRLDDYSQMLMLVHEAASDQSRRMSLPRVEQLIDKAVKRLSRRSRLFKEENVTVSEFLTEVRDSLEPARCANSFGMNAHHLLQRVVSHAVQGWTSARQTAHKSQTRPEYSYATTAIALFHKSWMESGNLPRPSELQLYLELERLRAARVLEGGKVLATVDTAGDTSSESSPVIEVKNGLTSESSKATTTPRKGRMGFEVVRVRVEEIVRAEGYVGRNKLAERIGCSTALIDRVVRSSTHLTKLAASRRSAVAGRRREIALEPWALDQRGGDGRTSPVGSEEVEQGASGPPDATLKDLIQQQQEDDLRDDRQAQAFKVGRRYRARRTE